MPNLIEGLQQEQNRVREIIREYKAIPNNAGMLAATMMELDVKKADAAIAEGDTIQMLVCLESLKTYEL